MGEPARDNVVAIQDPPPDPAPALPRQRGTDRRVWIGVGIVFVVLFALLVAQVMRVGALEEQVGALTGELEASRQTVEAYRGHLGAVRGQVGDLSQQMQALQDLVAQDPEATPATEPEAPAASSEAL